MDENCWRMIRDNQRQAVYRWENEIRKRWPEYDADLSLDECRELIVKVWNDYRSGQQPPKVSDGRGTRRAWGSRWCINLPRWARTKVVVLHEIAHTLQHQQPWHGPEFARLLLELMVHYAGIPARQAKSIAVHQKPRRVRFAQAADVPKPPSVAWRRWKDEERKLVELLRQHRTNEPDEH